MLVGMRALLRVVLPSLLGVAALAALAARAVKETPHLLCLRAADVCCRLTIGLEAVDGGRS
jgi:hypothetical protein